METSILSVSLAVITLLSVAIIVSFLTRKSKIPYTVSLMIVGVGLGYISSHMPSLNFLQRFQLSPDLVFYIFLPTLIFESAFHMNFKPFMQNLRNIIGYSTIGMMISIFLIGWGMHYYLEFPLGISLLFGAIVSATDPISVLALFKKIGAPKRLSIIIEGESLFNDGTALVVFGILLELVRNQSKVGSQTILVSINDFLFIIIGGALTGIILGIILSKLLDYVKNSKEIELSLTLILAHFTFIVAEYFFGVSGILATVAAGIIVGNYGAHKISPAVKDIVTEFWDYTAFLANSLIFLMVGILIWNAPTEVAPILPSIFVVITLVLITRAIMVYTLTPFLNLFGKRNRIPLSWAHVIQWSGLRGALAITLVLTLSKELQYYDEILIYTASIILFTTTFNGLTIEWLLNHLKLNSLSITERFQYDESKVLINQQVQKKLTQMKKSNFVSKDIYEKVSKDYKQSDHNFRKDMRRLYQENKKDLNEVKISRILKQYLLGIEKYTFKHLYANEEITQDLLIVLLNNINLQIENIDSEEKINLGKVTFFHPQSFAYKTLKKLGCKNLCKKLTQKYIMLRYEMFRARLIASSNVLQAISEIQECDLLFSKDITRTLKKKYQNWHNNAKRKLKILEEKDKKACERIQIFLAKKAALHVEEKKLKEFIKTGLATTKVQTQLMQDWEKRSQRVIL